MHNLITEERELIYKMLTTSTGKHLLDSGDAYGRNWQRNQKRTIDDFIDEPEATLNITKRGDTLDYDVNISLFHFLDKSLEINRVCREFNSIPCENWDGDCYGVSKEGQMFLDDRDATIKGDYNSYNGDSFLSQVIQYTLLDIDGDDYVLLQVHGGCDVRGGYTDAKLFKLSEDYFPNENAGFLIERGENRLGIDARGGQLEVWCNDWTESISLDEALVQFGEGEHQGYICC